MKLLIKRNCLLLLMILFSSGFVYAQKQSGSIRGILTDTVSNSVIADVTVSVLKSSDSSLVSFTITSGSGFFEIKNLPLGHYYLVVSYPGFQPLRKRFEVNAESPIVDLGKIEMERQYKLMDEVIVQDVAPVKIKGDTIAYNADAFKTKPNDLVEDLLKKLPGVSVEKDGTVKAQGEQVQKVYVDGKEFFGTDPKMATKNLSADMVSEVEVFDDMSEQSKFNKIDDGSRTKAINLKLKKEKKRGLFGQASAAYGTDERYAASLRTNFFKGATQVSVLANANNVNRQNFTGTDMLGILSGSSGGKMMIPGGGRFSGGGSSNNSNGITSIYSGGINYNDTWNRYFDISSSYNMNVSETDSRRNSFRQTFLGDSVINRSQDLLSTSRNNVHRGNVRLTYSMNENNSIIYSSGITKQKTETFRNDTSFSFMDLPDLDYKLSESRSGQTNQGEATNWTNNLIWRKKFSKAGRTLSLNLNTLYSLNDQVGFNSIRQSNYSETGNKLGESNLDQQNFRNSKNENYTVGLSYTEPLGRDKIWEMNYGYFNSKNRSDNRVYDFNDTTGMHDLPNPGLTNKFENQNSFNRIGSNFRVIKKKYNYQVGLSLQQTSLENNNVSKGILLKQTYNNLITNATFNYKFMRSKTLTFLYRGRTNQPTVNQLQPIREVSNAPYFYEGNPGLTQEFINNYSINYRFFDPLRMNNLFALVSFSHTKNKIVNSTQQLGFGSQLTKPVNVDGVFGINANVNMGFPVNKLKGGNVNFTTRFNYNRNASIIDGSKNYIKNLVVGEDARLHYNYKEKLELGLTASITYTDARYTIQEGLNTSYYTHGYSLDATYFLPAGIRLSSDIDVNANTGRSDGYNQSFTILNASIAKQLLKNKRGELKISAFDLLNTNTSLTRNVEDNYVEDVRTNVLNRYFLLSFTYNINRMAGKNMPGNNR